MENNLKVGQSVLFVGEKVPYKVMAVSNRYAVVSRRLSRKYDADLIKYQVEMGGYFDFNQAYKSLKYSPIYSILDFDMGIRSSDDLVFGIFDYKDIKHCQKAINYLEEGLMGLSRRNQVSIEIDTIKE